MKIEKVCPYLYGTNRQFPVCQREAFTLAKEGKEMLRKISEEFNHVDTSHLNEFLIKVTQVGGDDDNSQDLLQKEEATIPEEKR